MDSVDGCLLNTLEDTFRYSLSWVRSEFPITGEDTFILGDRCPDMLFLLFYPALNY